MTVYVVLWVGAFDDWEIKKVFSTEEKAKAYLKGKNENSWMYYEYTVE